MKISFRWITVCGLVVIAVVSVLRGLHEIHVLESSPPTVQAKPPVAQPTTSPVSVPTTKQVLFLMKLRETTDKQGWLIDSFIEGANNLIIQGYLTVTDDGIVRVGHVDHPVFEGDLSRLRMEEQRAIQTRTFSSTLIRSTIAIHLSILKAIARSSAPMVLRNYRRETSPMGNRGTCAGASIST